MTHGKTLYTSAKSAESVYKSITRHTEMDTVVQQVDDKYGLQELVIENSIRQSKIKSAQLMPIVYVVRALENLQAAFHNPNQSHSKYTLPTATTQTHNQHTTNTQHHTPLPKPSMPQQPLQTLLPKRLRETP